jgi:hypothetical protein
MRLFRKQAADVETVSFDPLLGDPVARRLEDAVNGRDWPIARAILATPLSSDDRQRLVSVAANVPGLETWIDGVVAAEREWTMPLLLKGVRYIIWAWEARGSGGAGTVAQETWKVWFNRLRQAEDCLDEVVEREPGNAEAWSWLITLGRARQVDKADRWRRFNGLLAAEPTHFTGNSQMLDGLMKKWSGSHEEMFDFARQRAAAHPGTHLPFLVAEAHIEYWDSAADHEYLEQAHIGDELVAVAHQSIWHPAYQRSFRTPTLLNGFAFAFALADRFVEAERCFAELGDHLLLEWPWERLGDPGRKLVTLRDYVRSNLS